MSPQREAVRVMFDEISPRYDFLNHFLSFGIDRIWRRRLVKEITRHFPPEKRRFRILDVATGTGDLAIAAAKLPGTAIDGIDISEAMMEIGGRKSSVSGLSDVITFRKGAAEQIPFEDDHFDVVMVAFGVRNFQDPDQGLGEMRRVLKPGGLMLVLEFSQPVSFHFKILYKFYSRIVIPVLGKLISRHSNAYSYLPETAASFPWGEAFLGFLRRQGLVNLRQIRLSGGIATLYCAEKSLSLPPD